MNGIFVIERFCEIRGCGVSFYIWTKKGTQGELNWSSLTGSDYEKLLENDEFFYTPCPLKRKNCLFLLVKHGAWYTRQCI
jgi:hypothetical protein